MPYEIVDVPEARALVAKATCTSQQIGPVIGEMFGGLIARFPEAELIEAPRLYYRQWSETTCDIEAAFIIEPDSLPGAHLTAYPRCRAAVTTHIGPYDGLSDAWMRFFAELQRDNIQPAASPPWDSYEVGAFQEEDPNQWVTELYVPLT